MHRIVDSELERNEQRMVNRDRDSTHLHRIVDGELVNDRRTRDSTHLHRIVDELEGNEQTIVDLDRFTHLHRIVDSELERNEQRMVDLDRDSLTCIGLSTVN